MSLILGGLFRFFSGPCSLQYKAECLGYFSKPRLRWLTPLQKTRTMPLSTQQQSAYSSDINNIYSDINKSSTTETNKSTIGCRKTSATFEYFHHLNHNTSVKTSLIKTLLIGVLLKFLKIEICRVQFTADTITSRCESEGQVDEWSVVLPFVFWTPLDERRAQVNQLLKQNKQVLFKDPLQTN